MSSWAKQIFAHPGEACHDQAVVDAVTARLAGHSLWTMSLHAPNGDELDVPGYARANLGNVIPAASSHINFGKLGGNCIVAGAVLRGPGNLQIKIPFSGDTLIYPGGSLTVDFGGIAP